MDNKKKYLPLVLIIGTIWLVLAVWSWSKSPQVISYSERRKLEQFPELSVSTVLAGEFMPEFEKYTLDQFPLRDSFRTLKGTAAFYLFGQKDNNKIYIANGYAAKLEYPLNLRRSTIRISKTKTPKFICLSFRIKAIFWQRVTAIRVWITRSYLVRCKLI